eukprot:13479548-Alexandrium_andersonii.AAC.1
MAAAAQAGPGPTDRAPGTMGVRLVDLEPGFGTVTERRIPAPSARTECAPRIQLGSYMDIAERIVACTH